MKTWLFIIVLLLFALGPPVGWSIENPAIRNPIGSATVPPSSIDRGLVNTPDPVDTTGNLVITGNVRRGRHFRGTVPYRSTTSFGSSVDSASLSSFLRDSAGSEDFGRYSGRPGGSYQPYYSRTETVTTTTPGRAGVFRPASTRSNNRARDVYGLEPLSKKSATGQSSQDTSAQSRGWQELSALGSQVPQMQYGTLAESQSTSLSPRPTERLAMSQVDPRRQSETLTVDRYRRLRQDPEFDSVPLKTQDSRTAFGPESGVLGAERQQSLPEADDAYRYSMLDPRYSQRRTSLENPVSRFEMQPAAESATGTEETDAIRYQLPTSKADEGFTELGEGDVGYLRTSTVPYQSSTSSYLTGAGQEQGQRGALPNLREDRVSGPDVLEQIRRQLDDLVTSIKVLEDQDSRPSPLPSGDQDSRALLGLDSVVPDMEGRSQERNLVPAEQYPSALEGLGELSAFPKTRKGVLGLSQADLSARAKRIMGPHKSLESFSDAKFTQHMRVAEGYLRAGRYYRAADSFALASIYEPDNPLALAGRGHALFAAGEYVSSALFVARALEIAPEYARTEIDLVAVLGDADKLAGRIADIERWLEGSGATELQFLLGYVYYRIGRLSQAKQAIDVVRERMPRSLAVQALGAAIDARPKTQNYK